MTAQLKYVELDGNTHVIGPAEYTACGEVIPYPGSTWTVDEPKKLCAKCEDRATDTDEFGVAEDQIEVAPTPFAAPEPAPVVEEAPKATKEAPKAKSGSKA